MPANRSRPECWPLPPQSRQRWQRRQLRAARWMRCWVARPALAPWALRRAPRQRQLLSPPRPEALAMPLPQRWLNPPAMPRRWLRCWFGRRMYSSWNPMCDVRRIYRRYQDQTPGWRTAHPNSSLANRQWFDRNEGRCLPARRAACPVPIGRPIPHFGVIPAGRPRRSVPRRSSWPGRHRSASRNRRMAAHDRPMPKSAVIPRGQADLMEFLALR